MYKPSIVPHNSFTRRLLLALLAACLVVPAWAGAAPAEIKQEILPLTGILAAVSTGKYDVAITAAIITKERKQSLDFTSPIADATHYYVKRKDDKSISSIKDLSGKTVGVQAGSALLARLPELGTMLEKDGGKLGKIVEYTSYPEAYQDLALGRVGCKGQQGTAGLPQRVHRQGKGQRPVCRASEEMVWRGIPGSAGCVRAGILTASGSDDLS